MSQDDIRRELEEYAFYDTMSQFKMAQRSCAMRGDCQDCVTPLLLSTLGTATVIGLVIALVIDELYQQEEKAEKIYMSPSQFEHKGIIDVEGTAEEFHLDVIDENDEVDDNPPDKHFTFTTYRNEVYDIGSEIEKAPSVPQSTTVSKELY
ncbi:unnamed protein product [Anisakis simplex]|uniref:Col_cuticle_N domain-containing protein n=1 Tax=Anisakis simplex TaxID=6269 RepID=A0A0M3J4A2_ANISI|nr:unnamed protein product [Anisakis simplex]